MEECVLGTCVGRTRGYIEIENKGHTAKEEKKNERKEGKC